MKFSIWCSLVTETYGYSEAKLIGNKILIEKKAKEHNISIEGISIVNPIESAKYEEYANNYDLILLGPQIRHLKPEIESKVSIPVDYIAPQHYGIMNGEAVFQDIKKILNIKEEE